MYRATSAWGCATTPVPIRSLLCAVVFSLVYVSSLTAPPTEEELRDLLHQCRTANTRSGITGLLLYRDSKFLHLLEGERNRVTSLFDKIKLDPRHQEVVVVREREQQEREFPDWSAGFGDLTDRLGWVEVLTGAEGAVVQTDTEAKFIGELLDLFDR